MVTMDGLDENDAGRYPTAMERLIADRDQLQRCISYKEAWLADGDKKRQEAVAEIEPLREQLQSMIDGIAALEAAEARAAPVAK